MPPSPAPPGPNGPGGPSTINTEAETLSRMQVKEALTPYGVDLLGERLDMHTGALSFQHLDVSIPGNTELEVAIRRSLRISGDKRARHKKDFGDWSLDVPSISMKVATVDGWKTNRCTSNSTPEDVTVSGTYYLAYQFWNGLHMNIPGQGSQQIFDSPQGQFPTSADKGTNQYWKIDCLSTISHGAGEGFTATSPTGVKYTFDYLAYEDTSWVGQLDRDTAFMLATKAEDRFGNSVEYDYETLSNVTKLKTITGKNQNGGIKRKITVTYTGDKISKVEANGREWTYDYNGSNHLIKVTLPSGLFWSITVDNLVNAGLQSGLKLVCGGAMAQRTGAITHPYGAVGEYTLNEISHGRTQVPYNFVNGAGTGGGSCIGEDVRTQRSYDTISLTQKKLSGPGLDDMIWNYTYSQTQGGWTTSSGVSEVNTTTVVDPEGHKTVHHFNRNYNWEEGAEEKTEIFDGTTTLLRTVENQFEVGPMLGGAIATADNDKPTRYPRSVEQRKITENGDTFTTDYEYGYASTSYDYVDCQTCYGYGRPTEISESNSINSFTMTTKNFLFSEWDDWMLALPKKTKVGSETISEFLYNNYQVITFKQYGVTVATRAYLSSGMINWEKNANLDRYKFSSWYRGMPRTIEYPDLETRVFTIDYFGNVLTAKDRASNTTTYTYDNMDRLKSITLPNEATGPNRVPKTIDYLKVTSSEYNDPNADIDQNQWKVETTNGDLFAISYLDAMLRPVIAKTVDLTDTPSDLDRFQRTAYDSGSRPVFQSFPSADIEADEGTDTLYDGLGRRVEVEENVTPFAKTTYVYEASNKIKVTNPRNKQVKTTYFALGSPTQEIPTYISQWEGIQTNIVRNNFGEMTSATQSGGGVSATRTYKYDSSHRLCRQIDPETGSTVYNYNNAGQLTWYALAASGGTGACNIGSVVGSEKINNTYNILGQLTFVNYPDSSPDLAYTYDDNGNLKTLNSSSANWTYMYNKIDALIQEKLVTNGQTFITDYDFDSQDRLTSMDYPSSLSVSIIPNAYGEPESVGSYASGIQYHPNGSIKSLTYGNNRVYTTTQNARQLPQELKIKDGGTNIAKLTHYYDANANITSINDGVTSAANRTMTYDNVDRLKTASGIWGSGSYTYDALGNIKTKNEGSDTISITYDSSNLVDDVAINSSVNSFSHDVFGNVTSNGDQTFTYNRAGNMLTSSSPSITNWYDGHNRRVRVLEGNNNSYTMYGTSGSLLHRKDGGVQSDYIYAGSMLVAKKEGSDVHYLHTDLLGSPIDGKVGATSFTENYSSWGEKLDNSIQIANDVGFTGHQSDIATRFTYMQARYYDSVVGRFMAVDPIAFTPNQPSSFNRYSYANNNPYKFVDPNGLKAENAIEEIIVVAKKRPKRRIIFIPTGFGDDGDQAGFLSFSSDEFGNTVATEVGSKGGTIPVSGPAGLLSKHEQMKLVAKYLNKLPAKMRASLGYPNKVTVHSSGMLIPIAANGRYLPAIKNPGVAASPGGQISVGIVQGSASQASGVEAPPPVGPWAALGQNIGRIGAMISSIF